MSATVSSHDQVRSAYSYARPRALDAAAIQPADPTQAAAVEATRTARTSAGATVTISPLGRALAAERARAERTAGTRDARIEALKSAVEAGTYAVSPRALATTLVKNFAQ